MTTYRLKIVGVHYAVNTDHTPGTPETEDMHTRTAQRLTQLDEARPRVLLMPEPSNPVDSRAVMARAQFKRIGYVNKEQLDIVHALLQASGGRPLMADICEVEARKHGWLFVEVKTEAEVPVEPILSPSEAWTEWTCTLPTIAPDEAQYAREEAEVMLDELLSEHIAETEDGTKHTIPETDIDPVEECIRLWMECALHDLSHEASLTREHYISILKEHAERIVTPAPRIEALVTALEKQRTAICGGKRMRIRTQEWWDGLMQSKEMDILWSTWKARVDNDLEHGMDELLAPLKALPFDLYALVDKKSLFFSRLHYNRVPRAKFRQIVSLLLLRQRALWGNETLPQSPTDSCLNETFSQVIVEIPKELQTSEAKRVLAKLQKKGYLDEDLQPVKLSNTQKSVLAWHLTEHLRIKKRWAVMATLWKCNPETLRKSYDKGYEKNVASEFTKKMKYVIC